MSARRIERIGIVNRGEAAMRCIRAVKALRRVEGSALEVVALYTEVERDAPFVRHADRAVRLSAPRGEAAAYLDPHGLLAALREAECDAVWPGWGFLAESPDFVERVEAAGLAFIGPGAAAMRALGDKVESKRLAEKAGVAVVPWSGGVLESLADAERAAAALGFPVVLKASAGGGGRGIRKVERPEQLAEAWRSARDEAEGAFGDARLFLERRVRAGRHVEVQIAADAAGCVRALGSRDCSVQRRHQKLLEEAPPPGLARERIAALEDAAVRLARSVGYRGLGTVEFLVEPEAFHFLEMNPRLQVEHGITEATTGLDLVQLQIRIARGESIRELAFETRGCAIEARLCAEDPDAGFLPAPGRVARFDPALGPGIRIDTGIAAGARIPAAFDSLIAKLIAHGASREEARARLAGALADLDLVIEGGAHNRGFLLEILEHERFRGGAPEISWLDGWLAERDADARHAHEALVAAAILSYQRNRALARLNFFAETGEWSDSGVPRASGQEIDLSHRGQSYRLRVFAVGSWRYRVHLEGHVLAATLREESANAARLEIGGRSLRLLYDHGEGGLRIEVEGRPHVFAAGSAGEVRAAAPAMVVAIQVRPGDVVSPGQPLGLLEAMKMEIGFDAPVAGKVLEVCVARGQQVAAGDVLLRIEPSAAAVSAGPGPRIRFEPELDPLEPLFREAAGDRLAEPHLAGIAGLAARPRRRAFAAVREEVRRVLLGYDANPERAERLVAFLEAPLPPELAERPRLELAGIRHELVLFADVATLFARSPQDSVSGPGGPSNYARLRMLVRRLRAGGAGVDEGFLALARAALAHYGIESLAPGDALERAVLRLLASQSDPALRDRLVLACLRRLGALARQGVQLGDEKPLLAALERIARLRGMVSDAVADAAIDVRYEIFERPEIERAAARSHQAISAWLDALEDGDASAVAPAPLAELADAAEPVFARVAAWLADADPERRRIAVEAHVRRLYSPRQPLAVERLGGALCLRFPGIGRVRASVAAANDELAEAIASLLTDLPSDGVHALELFAAAGLSRSAIETALRGRLRGAPLPARLSISRIREADAAAPQPVVTLVSRPEGLGEAPLYGLHPEAAARVGLARLAAFELERLPARVDLYAFHGRSRREPSDERLFVLGDLRSRLPEQGGEARLPAAAFEQLFQEAARTLRVLRAERDPQRRLAWNRIAVHVAHPVRVDAGVADALARRLAPSTRHLGLEKVLVRLRRLDPEDPDAAARELEIEIASPADGGLAIVWRDPVETPLATRTAHERRLAEARRRGLTHPHEIVRLLREGWGGVGPGRFEEHDLDPEAPEPQIVSVAGRAPGGNGCGVVVGIASNPTAKVPEGVERVLILSDPSHAMGALAAPECDRIVAALDLADERALPVEWVAVSSGARIAMDSGTENLDATARVVRRIVRFTGAGGAIHVIVPGVNVGAQSYFDALATMGMGTRGALILTERGSLVLTGRAALAASGSVGAEDETAIGGFERVMGPNGEAQYLAAHLTDAYRLLFEHYRHVHVVPGEAGPRRLESADPRARSVLEHPIGAEGDGLRSVGEIFDPGANPGRKRPFPMRAVMQAVIDADAAPLERWAAWVGAETAIVWDAHLGGWPVCLIGIESRNVVREGYRPKDGPAHWTGGTLFPLSSKKVARALRAASGNRPVVMLANLSGFDGSPESMRKLQLEYGAEIARAVVEFEGPIVFLVVSRYHGGAYVVFSRALHPRLRAAALRGSHASVIGGGPAAAVVFPREVRARALADPRVVSLQQALRAGEDGDTRDRFESVLAAVQLEKQAELAAEFDAVHSVERAREVGSLEAIVEPAEMRPWLIEVLDEELRG